MEKFFIYSGTRNPDNCDEVTHNITILNSEAEVLEFYNQFLADITKEDCDIEFRVIKGVEMKLTPVEKVTTYKLASD